jgi:hypothetical protein
MFKQDLHHKYLQILEIKIRGWKIERLIPLNVIYPFIIDLW